MYKSIKLAIVMAIVMAVSGCVVAISDSSYASDESSDVETQESVALTMNYLADKVVAGRYSVDPGNYYLTEDLELGGLYLYINSKIDDVRMPTTIDLGNFTISSSATNTINAMGELTINSGPEGKVINTGTGSNSGAVFCNSTTTINGGTFEGEKNAIVNNQYFSDSGTITINGGTFSGNYALKIADGNVTINNGTFTGGSFGLYCYSTGGSNPSVTIENGTFIGTDSAATVECAWSTPANLTINSGNFTGNNGIVVLGHNDNRGIASLTINDGTITGTNGSAVNGNGSKDNTHITINDGVLTGNNNPGIFHPQSGDLTVNGGTITGESGIQFCGSGSIEINGGTIRGTYAEVDGPEKPSDQKDGAVIDGAALSIVSRGTGYQDDGTTVSVTVNGGTLISDNNSPVSSYRFQKNSEGVWVSNDDTDLTSSLESFDINGGSFEGPADKPSIAFDESQDSEGKYSVSGGTFTGGIEQSFIEDGVDFQIGSDGSVSVGDDIEDDVFIPPIWDDDDDYVPPIVPSQTEDSGDDDTTTIVACAAAAVVAALMAAFLILDRRH